MTPRPPQALGSLRLDVATPCGVDWAQMQGDEKRRFCGQCRKHVHNLSALTDDELAAWMAENQATSPCVRFYKRKDGTVLTEDCPVGLRKRVVRRMAIAAGAVMAASAAVLSAAGYAAFRSGPSCNPVLMGEVAMPAPPIDEAPVPKMGKIRIEPDER